MMAAHDNIREEVALPDPEVQRLVHPLDLPDARPLFRTGWLIGAVTGLPVAVLVAAIVGYASRSAVPPIAVFLAMTGFGALAARWYTDRAWDYVPRKRQTGTARCLDGGTSPRPESWPECSAWRCW